VPAGTPVDGTPPKTMPKPKVDKEVSIPAPATVVVNLPADAKLRVDDYVTTSTSATRVFVSPNLTPGEEFSYTLTAEAVRDGKTVVASRKIAVRAGEETRVSLEFPVASVASK
jgi:uncharacterized protein (TIGR03000 family)